MVMLVVRVWCFLGQVLALLGVTVSLRTNLHWWGKCRDLNLGLQFKMLPSVHLVLSFHASKFQPNKLWLE